MPGKFTGFQNNTGGSWGSTCSVRIGLIKMEACFHTDEEVEAFSEGDDIELRRLEPFLLAVDMIIFHTSKKVITTLCFQAITSYSKPLTKPHKHCRSLVLLSPLFTWSNITVMMCATFQHFSLIRDFRRLLEKEHKPATRSFSLM